MSESNFESNPRHRSLQAAHQVAPMSRSVVYRSNRQAGPEEESGSKLGPAFLWWTFCQWWRVVLPVGLVLAGISALVVVATYVPLYQSSALVMIEDMAPYIAFKGASGGNSQMYIRTQIETMRSPLVLEPVLSQPEIASLHELLEETDKVKHMQQHLSIRQVGGSELYFVSYTSESPEAARQVANAVVGEYLNIQQDEEFQRSQRVIDLLEEERRRRALEVERKRQNIITLAKEVTGRDPFAGGSVLDFGRAMNPVAGIFRELTELEIQIQLQKIELKSREESSLAMPDPAKKSGLIDVLVEEHPRVASKLNALNVLNARIEGYDSQRLDESTDKILQAMLKEKKSIEESLGVVREEAREVVIEERRKELKSKNEESIGKIGRELATLETRRDLLQSEFDKNFGELQKGSGKSIELEFAKAELEREEKVFEMIESRKLAMQTEMRAPARIRLRRSAETPQRPISPIPFKMLFLACTASLVAPFGLAVLREISVKRVNDVEQLASESQVRVLGEISHFPIKRVAVSSGSMSASLRRQMFLYNESIDSLRTSIALSSEVEDQQVILITSAAAAEGKTSVATSLAMSIASATKERVLIIDADMRAPDVASILATRSQPGLAELLRQEVSLEDAIQKVGDTNVYVIPAGRLRGNPHHLLQEDVVTTMLGDLRKQFPKIVIDTPPIFGGSEALMLAKQSDAVLVSTMCNVSRIPQVRSAVERLHHAGANVIGSVLNGKSASGYAYSYGYGSYSGRLESHGG